MVAYVHQIDVRIGNFEFEDPVAIADSNDVPSILGRALLDLGRDLNR